MAQPTLFTFSSLVLLLLSCMCVNSQYVPLGPSSIVDLGKKVTEELAKSVVAELQIVNSSINQIQPAIDTCFRSIETRQSECGQCIDSSCQQRVDTLKCQTVTLQPVSQCTVSPALCLVKETVSRAKNALKNIEAEIKQIVEKVIKAVSVVIKDGAKVVEGVQKVIGQGVNLVKDELQKVGDKLKQTADSVKTVAENVANGAEKALQTVAAGVKEAAENVKTVVEKGLNDVEKVAKDVASGVKNTAQDVAGGVKDVVNKVKDFFGRIRLRRRRSLANQPTCDQLDQLQNACLFYQGWCKKCDVFGTSEAPSNVFEIVTGVCGSSLTQEYERLGSLLNKVDKLIGAAESFALNEVNFNPATVSNGAYTDVVVNFGVGVANYTLNMASPILPFDINSSGPAIAKDIFSKLFA